MTTDSFGKNSYELHFQKCQQNKEDFRIMDYMEFLSSLELLYPKLAKHFSSFE